MGCDIHAHIEVKLNGTWQHWNAPHIDRDYELFGRLAGVRRPEFAMFGNPRGIPADITPLTAWDYEESFGHTASWITWQELNQIMRIEDLKYPSGHGVHKVFGYLVGHDYAPYNEVTDIRMVFWFDN